MQLTFILWLLSVVSQSFAIDCYQCENTLNDTSCQTESPEDSQSKSCGEVPKVADQNKFDRFVCGTWEYTMYQSNATVSSAQPTKGFKRQCVGIRIEKNSANDRLHAYKVSGQIIYGRSPRPGPSFVVVDPHTQNNLTYEDNKYQYCDDTDNCNLWVSSASHSVLLLITLLFSCVSLVLF